MATGRRIAPDMDDISSGVQLQNATFLDGLEKRSARRFHNRAHFLLNDSHFRRTAECERMRVDRNGSQLSVLFFSVASARDTSRFVHILERKLESRLRATDTAGLLDDGRVGVLLPDTPASGAWKVASDICEVFDFGEDRPDCEVEVYPRGGEPNRSALTSEERAVSTRDSAPIARSSQDISLFVQPLPTWKRAIDIVGASLGLVLSMPILMISAALIKCTSPGPVFFSQEREGIGGRRFWIFKLRTMRIGAEQQQHELRALSEQDGPAFKLSNDPRTTRFGFWLRKLSIDELPQFWNVLKGEMTLVGPRPLPTEESLRCNSWQRRRLDTTPGMTCTWQVWGRNQVSFDQWMRMDLQYNKTRSLWSDIKLLVLTIPSALFSRGPR